MPEAGPVVVVGGGITGLVAAHQLLQAGVDAAVVDASPRLGGKVQTEHIDGFVVEAGPDSFVAGKKAVLELASELGLEGAVQSTRPEAGGSQVWWDGELHPLPEGLLLMAPSRLAPLFHSSLLTWRGKLRVLGDLFLPRGGGEDESLESFVLRRLGREMLERVAQPLVAGIHAAEPRTMSLRASFPRFLEMERNHRSLVLAARAATKRAPKTDGRSHFVTFAGGMGRLTDALADSISAAEVSTGVAVSELRPDGAGYRLVLDDGTTVEAAAVVLAVPARTAARLLAPIVPEASAAIGGIAQVSTSTATLVYRSHEIPDLRGTGFVVPAAQDRKVTGVTFLSNKWPGRVPDDRFVMVRAFVGGRHGQQAATSSPEQLMEVVRADLAEMVGLRADPVLVRVSQWEGGLHRYTIGHLERVAEAETALSGHPRLALAGAAFHGIGLNECVASGRRAAARLLAVAQERSSLGSG
ncbi:MAG TPA: protoporphyrinogen oxidase [Acidimicrobiia bacterium]|nr:protoporphyrinogen oxidase [Acidimicrobiia bacterium]